jgi:hypothetical protein
MAALEVDLYKKRLIDASMTGQGNTTKVLIVFIQTLDSLITRVSTPVMTRFSTIHGVAVRRGIF